MTALRKSMISSSGMARLLIGLAQGVSLYLLYQAQDWKVWPATQATQFVPLTLVLWSVPVLLLLGIGNLRRGKLALWSIAAAAVLAGLAVHDILRGSTADWATQLAANQSAPRLWPSPVLVACTIAGLFIGQSLIVAGGVDRKLIAFYPRHFDAAWKHAVQLALALLFVGIFLLILELGAGLFKLIGIDFFKELIGHRWFAFPATSLAFACAIHATDVRADIVRGMRTLLLVLLSWLLPLMTLIAVGFLASLPFTGLTLLWRTRFATTLLLVAAAALVLLVNAAYRDGSEDQAPNRVLRVAGSGACLALVPLVAIAAYALGLRVDQHGWTTQRIIAASVLLVGACYALGYAWAALSRGAWLQRIRPCNVATAFVILAVMLGLLTPVADPARLSVTSQLARLKSGKVSADKFDFAYLRFHGARYGQAALERLKAEATGPDAATVRLRATQALAQQNQWQPLVAAPTPEQLAANISVYPTGRTLPASFLQQNWRTYSRGAAVPGCLGHVNEKCEAILLDLDGDGSDEILLDDERQAWNVIVFKQVADGTWRDAGRLSGLVRCVSIRDALRNGTFKLVPTPWRDIEVLGVRLHLYVNDAPANGCP